MELRNLSYVVQDAVKFLQNPRHRLTGALHPPENQSVSGQPKLEEGRFGVEKQKIPPMKRSGSK
jgi:hypothetical protein